MHSLHSAHEALPVIARPARVFLLFNVRAKIVIGWYTRCTIKDGRKRNIPNLSRNT